MLLLMSLIELLDYNVDLVLKSSPRESIKRELKGYRYRQIILDIFRNILIH